MNSILKKLFNLLFISSGLLYGVYANAIEESTNWAFSRIHTNALPSSLNIDYDSLSLYFKQRPIQISQKNLVIGNICTIKLSKEDIIPLDLQKMLTVDVNQYFIDKATDYPFIQLFTDLEIKAPYDFYQFNLPGMQIAFPDWMKKNTIKGYETQAFGNPFELSQSDCSMNLISNHFRKAVFNEKYLIIFFSVYSKEVDVIHIPIIYEQTDKMIPKMITNTSFIPLDFAYPDSPLEYAFRYDGYFKSLILNDAFAVSHIQEDLSNIIPHEVIESFIMNRDATTIVRFEAFESFNLDLYVQDDVDYTKSKYQYFYPKHFNLIHKIDYKNKQPHAELINSKTNQKYLINHDEFEKKFNEANEFPLNEGFIDQQSFQFFEEKETLCVHAEAVFYDHNLSKNRPFIFKQCLDG